MSQPSYRVRALQIAQGLPAVWKELSPAGRRLVLTQIELVVQVLDRTIRDPAVRERVFRALADPDT